MCHGVDALRCSRPEFFDKPLHCKFGVILYPTPDKFSLSKYLGENKSERGFRFDETTMRMLLKGACHFLYGQGHHVNIINIFSDGQPKHRRLDEDRVLKRVVYDDIVGKSPLRGYVTISENLEVYHMDSNHLRHDIGSADHAHANFLQLTDMLLGGAINACLKENAYFGRRPRIGEEVEAKKPIVSTPIREMLDKRKRGSGFDKSSHYKSFTLTRATIEHGHWVFENLNSKDVEIEPLTGQLSLRPIG
jgi:hypothetical protein